MINFLSTVVFPARGGIQNLVLITVEWIYGFMGNYALSIIFFAFMLRLVMAPLDFGNRYFTKKNQMKMAELKPEMDSIAQTYKDDPVAMYRARQDLFRKQGAGLGGFFLFTILNLVVMMIVFISVFQALNSIGSHNINHQFSRMQDVYVDFHERFEDGQFAGEYATWEDVLASEGFRAAMNERYQEYRTGFLWIRTMWQSDTPWARRTPTFESLNTDNRAQYDAIWSVIDDHDRRANGWLLLILGAGAATFFSAWLNKKHMSKNKPTSTETKEKEVGYSMREAKNQTDGEAKQLPQMDPAKMGKMMMIIMPIVMIIVSMTMTAAMALYIIFSQLIATGFGFGFGFIVKKILDKQEAKKKEAQPDMTIINPHSKYFKGKQAKG